MLWLEAGDPELVIPGKSSSSIDRVSSFAPVGTWWYEVRVRQPPPTPSTFEFSISARSRRSSQLALIDERGIVSEARASRPHGDRVITLPESAQHPRRFLLRVVTSRPTEFQIGVRMTWIAPPAPVEPVLVFEDHPDCDLKKPDFKNPNCCQAPCGLARRTCRGTILGGDKKWAEISLGTNDHIPRGSNGVLWQPEGHRHSGTSSFLVFDVGDNKSLVQFSSPDLVDPARFANSYVILSPPDGCIRQSRP